MADFEQAFAYLMKFEDDGMSGRVTKDAGGRTRFGLAERFHGYLRSTGFFDSLPKEEAMMLAQSTYEHGEWAALSGAGIASQELANKMLSLAVNLGTVRVVRWAQEAAGVHPDGIVGYDTLKAWNADSGTPFHAISMDAQAHYRQLALDNPLANAKYLQGWLRRAKDPATSLEAA